MKRTIEIEVPEDVYETFNAIENKHFMLKTFSMYDDSLLGIPGDNWKYKTRYIHGFMEIYFSLELTTNEETYGYA